MANKSDFHPVLTSHSNAFVFRKARRDYLFALAYEIERHSFLA